MASHTAQPHPNTLTSTRTLVVGGTSGLGAAVVSALLANGGSVHIASSNQDKINTKITEFSALYPNNNNTSKVSGTTADLSDEKTLEANAQRILSEAVAALGGPLDHIVYTAGDAFSRAGGLAGVEASTFFRGWNVRFLGPLIFGKIIKANPAGTYVKSSATSSITLTSGVLAHRPAPGSSQFIGVAGAVEALARGLAVDLQPLRCNAVCPGAILTEMWEGTPEERLGRLRGASLTKTLGSATECAEAYLYCLRSSFVTGEMVKCDGGAVYA